MKICAISWSARLIPAFAVRPTGNKDVLFFNLRLAYCFHQLLLYGVDDVVV